MGDNSAYLKLRKTVQDYVQLPDKPPPAPPPKNSMPTGSNSIGSVSTFSDNVTSIPHLSYASFDEHWVDTFRREGKEPNQICVSPELAARARMIQTACLIPGETDHNPYYDRFDIVVQSFQRPEFWCLRYDAFTKQRGGIIKGNAPSWIEPGEAHISHLLRCEYCGMELQRCGCGYH